MDITSLKSIEVLNNQAWNKNLGYIDSFYINSATVANYNKNGAKFINQRKSIEKMYNDIHQGNIKIPEIIDDNWVNVTLSRYIDQDIKLFQEKRSPSSEYIENDIINNVLDCFIKSKVMVNYEGLSVAFKINNIENSFFNCEVVTTIRGKITSSFTLKGFDIDFCGITTSAKNLQKHEVLTLQIFLSIESNKQKINIILSKFGDYFSKVFIDDGCVSVEKDFNCFGIEWNSFNINRGM